MKAALVKIGNSQGIRIPQPILEHCGLRDEVELTIQNRELIIRPVHHPRQGWEEAFQRMAQRGDDTLLDTDTVTSWDDEEWEWN